MIKLKTELQSSSQRCLLWGECTKCCLKKRERNSRIWAPQATRWLCHQAFSATVSDGNKMAGDTGRETLLHATARG